MTYNQLKMIEAMVIQVDEFSKADYKNRKIKINIPKGKYWILRIGGVASCQKLGIFLGIKWLSKNVLLSLYFSMENKLRQIPIIFDIENGLQRSNVGSFCHLPTTPILKIQ